MVRAITKKTEFLLFMSVVATLKSRKILNNQILIVKLIHTLKLLRETQVLQRKAVEIFSVRSSRFLSLVTTLEM